jgi:hypothetical protein
MKKTRSKKSRDTVPLRGGGAPGGVKCAWRSGGHWPKHSKDDVGAILAPIQQVAAFQSQAIAVNTKDTKDANRLLPLDIASEIP